MPSIVLAPIDSPNFPRGASTEGQGWVTQAQVKALRQELLASLRQGVIDSLGIAKATSPVGTTGSARSMVAMRTKAVEIKFSELIRKKDATYPVVDSDFLFEDGSDASKYVSRVSIVTAPEMSYYYKNGIHYVSIEPGSETLFTRYNSRRVGSIDAGSVHFNTETTIRMALTKGGIVPMLNGQICFKLDSKGTYVPTPRPEKNLVDFVADIDDEYKLAITGGKSYNKVYDWPAYLNDLRTALQSITAFAVVSYMSVLPD